MYSEAMSERRNLAIAAIDAAEATQLASLQATRLITQAFIWSPVFAARFITQATFLAFGLVEQRGALAKQPTNKFVEPASSTAFGAANASPVTTLGDAAQAEELKTIGDVARAMAKAADDAVQAAAARKRFDDAAQALAIGLDDAAGAIAEAADDAAPAFATAADDAGPALATLSDDGAPAFGMTADDAAPALATTDDEDQEIQLRAERLVVKKQRVRHGEARVRKEIVTEVKSIDVPVSHEELVIDRFAVTGNGEVEGEPIADETIRIPLTEEHVNVTKETVVREEVEFGKRRVDDVEHISDTVRHEELHVDNTATDQSHQPAF